MITVRIAAMDFTGPGTPAVDADADAIAAWVDHGDRAALDGLFRRHAEPALRLAGQRLGNLGDAEDAVQEAFIGAMRGAAGFRPGRGSVRGWLMAAVLNACHEQRRGEGRRKHRESAGAPPPSANGPDPDLADAIAIALGELPDHQRQAIELRYLAGLDFPEIAGALGRPERTVRGQVSRGLEALRAICARLGLTATAPALESALATPRIPAPDPAAIARCVDVARHGPAAAPATATTATATAITIAAIAAALALAGAVLLWSLLRAPAAASASRPGPMGAASAPPPVGAPPVTAHLPVRYDLNAWSAPVDPGSAAPDVPDAIIGSRADDAGTQAGHVLGANLEWRGTGMGLRDSNAVTDAAPGGRPPVPGAGRAAGVAPISPPLPAGSTRAGGVGGDSDAAVAATASGNPPGWSAPGAGRPLWVALVSPPLPPGSSWRPVAIERSGTDLVITMVSITPREWDHAAAMRRAIWTLSLGTLPAGDYHLSVRIGALDPGGVPVPPLAGHAGASGTFTVAPASAASAVAAVAVAVAKIAWSGAASADAESFLRPGAMWMAPVSSGRFLAPSLAAANPVAGLLGLATPDLSGWSATQLPGLATILPPAADVHATAGTALIRLPRVAGDTITDISGITWQGRTATIDLEVWTTSGQDVQRTSIWNGLLLVPLDAARLGVPADGAAGMEIALRWHHYDDAHDGRGYVEAPVPAAWTRHASWPAADAPR